jgi:hypothetical protein
MDFLSVYGRGDWVRLWKMLVHIIGCMVGGEVTSGIVELVFKFSRMTSRVLSHGADPLPPSSMCSEDR